MNIDRHNYEEFFILYLDNELSADDRGSVEDFAAAHPDLKEELDLLLQSKLEPDSSVIFNGKEELLKHSTEIGTHNYTEWLLLYTDNELPASQKTLLEQWIAENPTAQQELALLQKTRFQPEDHIVFPHKHLLYRQEERRVVAIRWWRMAAAAALLLAVSTAAFMFNRKDQSAIAGLGNDDIKPVAQTVQTITDSPAAAAINAPASADAITITDYPAVTTDPATTSRAIDNAVNKIEQPGINVIEKTDQPVSITEAANTATENTYQLVKRTNMIETLDASQPVDNIDMSADPSLTIQKQITPLPGVTQEDAQSLDNIVDQSGKKNKLRGFFRKITRTFEKTTNIKATDGEDRLLVGGLAIKF